MTTQARVGIFTILSLVGAFAVYYFVTNLALHHNGYQIGVHFRDVGGLQEGSSVLLSGVQIGEVTQVQLLPDQTVDVICTINPGNGIFRNSVFMVAITITGGTSLTITPPAIKEVAMILPQRILPEDQQPWGTLPPTLTDLMSAGQEQLKNFSKTMAVVNQELPALARKFALAADNTNRLIVHTDQTVMRLTDQLSATVALLNSTITTSSGSIRELTGNLNGMMADNRGRITTLVENLAKTSDNLNKTMEGVSSIASDPVLHQSLVGTAQNVEQATAKLKAIAGEIEGITGDPKTESQLKGTIANLDAISAKANNILGGFAASERTESGNASPQPGGNASPQPGGSASPQPGGSAPPRRGGRRGMFGQPLVRTSVRETWSNRGGGPTSDLNVDFLPGAATHLSLGANDLGYSTTYNFLVEQTPSRQFSLGGGVLYSKLGIAALFRPFGGAVGIDARVYDPKHPTLDLYGDLRLAQRLDLFYGERSIWGTAGKTPSFGIQINY